MKEINFISSNVNKAEEIRILAKDSGIRLKWVNYPKVEIQAKEPSEVAMFAGIFAYSALRMQLILEDTAVFIDALNGFPGVYAADLQKVLGLKGVLKLLEDTDNRKAVFKTAFCYVNNRVIKIFEGSTEGKITKEIMPGRQFGYDKIFVPEGSKLTYSQMSLKEKNKHSHRAAAFRKFASFFAEL